MTTSSFVVPTVASLLAVSYFDAELRDGVRAIPDGMGETQYWRAEFWDGKNWRAISRRAGPFPICYDSAASALTDALKARREATK